LSRKLIAGRADYDCGPRHLAAEKARLWAKWEKNGLSEEEKEEVWESQEPSIMEDILEALDAERMDAGGQYRSFE